MRTTVSKRITSAILAICLVFGSAAALPKSTFADTTNVIVSAEAQPQRKENGNGKHEETKPFVKSDGEKTENGFKYVSKDGAAVIVGVENDAATIVIPETLGGLSVTAIGEGALSDLKKLTSVEIPSSVESISKNAFNSDQKLAEVIFSEGITNIGEDAFADCQSLKSVIIPKSLKEIGKNAFGIVYEYIPGGKHETYDKDFTFYASSSESPAHQYAHERDMKFVRIAANSRLAGSNRYGTANIISQIKFETAETVIIASGAGYADALAGVSLAKMCDSPILLTAPASISKETLDEIKRLGAKNAIILGGTGAVSEKVEKTLKDNGIKKIERLGGKSRFETATLIADKMAALSKNKPPEDLFFVFYNNYADAVSVSSAAGAVDSPVLFVKTNGDIDDSTKAYIEKVKKDVKNVYVIGGEGVISNDMMKTIDKYTGKKSKRLGGKTRFDTNLEVVKEFAGSQKVLDSNGVGLATGVDYPDALTGGAVCAMAKAPIILVHPRTGLTEDQKSAISAQKKADANDFEIVVFGGYGAVSKKTEREACMIIQFKDEHQGDLPFEKSCLFKFIKKMDSEPFEAELVMNISGLQVSDTITKKSGKNLHTKTVSMLGNEESYTIDGKTYTLDYDTKTYTVENAESGDKSIIGMLIDENTTHDLISSKEDNGNIVEIIRQTTVEGDEVKVTEITCTFNKQTGYLTRIETIGGETPMSVEVKYFKPGPQDIKLPDLTDWTEEKGENDFEDSLMYQFLQKISTAPFESEMELEIPDAQGDPIKMPVIFKKGGGNLYQKQETPLGLEETYKVDGKAYFLLTQADIKRYNVKDSVEASETIVESFFSNDKEYELNSSKEEGDNIVEKITATPTDGDPYLMTCTFNKKTGMLITLETNASKLTIISFKTGPQQIKKPDLTGWEKDETLEF